MLHAILTDPDNGYLYIRADGQLSEKDHTDFIPALDQLTRSDVRKLPVMLELGNDLDDSDVKKLWKALKLDGGRRDRFSRIAVVGDGPQERAESGLPGVSFDDEMRFFEHAKRANAEQWLRGEPLTPIP